MPINEAFSKIAAYIKEDKANFEDREDYNRIALCLDAEELLKKLIRKIAEIDEFYGE